MIKEFEKLRSRRERTGQGSAGGSICLMLIVLWLCLMLFPGTVSAANEEQDNIQLSKSNVTILKDHTVRLKISGYKGTPKWSSSKPEIATVTQGGLVRGLQTGWTVVRVVCGKQTLQCRVAVRKVTADRLAQLHRQEKKDPGGVVLAGSSSIQRWASANSALEPYRVLNMGIDGSRVGQWRRWYKKLVKPYHPQAVVVYLGTNDIYRDASGVEHARRLAALLDEMHKALPETMFFYVSIVHTPLRYDRILEEKISNREMRDFCQSCPYATYIDLASVMRKKNGRPEPRLFLDGQHPNKEGYALWNKVVAAAVKEYLDGPNLPEEETETNEVIDESLL